MPLQIIPSIDLRAGKVVRLQQGDFARQIDYDLDPIATSRSFAQAGATLMHVVDLDGAKAGRVEQIEFIGTIAGQAGIAVQAGGGVRSTVDVERLSASGVSRIVVGTAALRDWAWFDQLAHSHAFAGRLVLAIDAKNGLIATHGWTETSSLHVLDVAQSVRGWPLAGLLYTDVARDGMLQGPNVDLTDQIAQSTDVPVIASGGVGTLDHIRQLTGRHIAGVILGRSLHDGRVRLEEAIALTH